MRAFYDANGNLLGTFESYDKNLENSVDIPQAVSSSPIEDIKIIHKKMSDKHENFKANNRGLMADKNDTFIRTDTTDTVVVRPKGSSN